MLKEIKKHIYQSIAKEISTISKYFASVIQWQAQDFDNLDLLNSLDTPKTENLKEDKDLPGSVQENLTPNLYLLNANLNYSYDIEKLLTNLKQFLSKDSRVAIVAYNPYLKWLYSLLNLLDLRSAPVPTTFITKTDLNNLCKLSGYEIVRSRSVMFFPFKCLGIGNIINKLISIIPFINNLSLTYIAYLRPVINVHSKELPSLSIIIPARNEAGNIENALKQMPYLNGAKLEIIFVEGHSNDNTWDTILEVKEKYKDQYDIKAVSYTHLTLPTTPYV